MKNRLTHKTKPDRSIIGHVIVSVDLGGLNTRRVDWLYLHVLGGKAWQPANEQRVLYLQKMGGLRRCEDLYVCFGMAQPGKWDVVCLRECKLDSPKGFLRDWCDFLMCFESKSNSYCHINLYVFTNTCNVTSDTCTIPLWNPAHLSLHVYVYMKHCPLFYIIEIHEYSLGCPPSQ